MCVWVCITVLIYIMSDIRKVVIIIYIGNYHHDIRQSNNNLCPLVPCRMDRYMKSVQRGKATATPELVKLWGSEAGSDRVANSVDLDFVCTGCPL